MNLLVSREVRQHGRPLQQSTEPLTCSSLISHVGAARRDLFEIRIVIKDGLRLQLVAGQSIQSASCCFSAWEIINIVAAQAKPMQVSNILKLASFRKITMFLITPLRDLLSAPRMTILSASFRQRPLCRQGKKPETGYRDLVGRYPNRLVNRL